MRRVRARFEVVPSAYYQSPAWWRRRSRVRRRAQGICEFCLLRPMAHCHHRTYSNFGYERSRELMAVCAPCHRYIHGLQHTVMCDPQALGLQGDTGKGLPQVWLAYLHKVRTRNTSRRKGVHV